MAGIPENPSGLYGSPQGYDSFPPAAVGSPGPLDRVLRIPSRHVPPTGETKPILEGQLIDTVATFGSMLLFDSETRPTHMVADYSRTLGHLSPALVDLLEKPNRQHEDRTDGTVDSFIVLQTTTFFPTRAPLLVAGWELLAKRVQDPEAPLMPRLVAAMTADALRSQTEKPPEEKLYWLISRKDAIAVEHKKALRTLSGEVVVDGAENDRLDGILADAFDPSPFQEFTERLATEDARAEVVHDQLDLLDAFHSFTLGKLSYACYQLSGDEGMAAQMAKAASELGTEVSKKPQVAAALLNGEIEHVNAGLRYAIWANATVDSAPGEDVTGQLEPRDKVNKYLIDHEEMQRLYWNDFTAERMGDSTINGSYEYASTFFKAPPNRVGEFLGTIPFEAYDKSQKRTLVRQIAGMIAAAHGDPAIDETTAEQLRAELVTLTRRAELSPDMLARELAVMEGRTSGVIALNSRYEAHAKEIPSDADTAVAYTSPFEAPAAPVIPRKREINLLQFEPGEEHSFFVWHGKDVQAASIDNVPTLLTRLGERLRGTGVSSKTIRDRVFQLAHKNRIVHGDAPTVIPELLPQDNPMSKLHDAGVRAVVPDSEGYGFSVLVDASEIGIQVDGAPTLAVVGELSDSDGVKGMEIIGEGDDQVGTDIHEALFGAALLARRPVTPVTLTGPEKRDVRDAVAGWNEAGHGTRLAYSEGGFDPDREQVVYLAGKKAVVLSVYDSPSL